MKFFRVINSFIPALVGLRFLVKNENNFKFHILAFGLIICCGFFLGINRFEWLFLVLSAGMVFVAEGINTAIEKTADEIDLKRNPHIKRIKDISSAAVLLAALFSVLVGTIIFFPYLMKLFCDTL
ncbi:MAG: diacylglycerol kinase family protein [Bacteroidetes bacterium]|nr:diacylglycerol kinase family protein [Bacteroidota bacterium]